MSYITDLARDAHAAQHHTTATRAIPGQMLDDVIRSMPLARRTMLRGGFGAGLGALFGSMSLVACGGSDAVLPPEVAQAAESFAVSFQKIAATTTDSVSVPAGYTMEVLFSAGDAVEPNSVAYAGTPLGSVDTEKFAGGNHDGMIFFVLPGIDGNKRGLLAINHEAPDAGILGITGYNPATATAEQKKIILSSVGVSIIEVQEVAGKWTVVKNSVYNKRYTGNSNYRVSGPAAAVVGSTVIGTLNNCASGETPWGTYLTCEETTDNYLDPAQPPNGYGWVVEIDPQNQLAGMPVKRTALGRFDHENTAYMLDSANNLAIYMGDDSTPGCIYKFVPSAKFTPDNRAANTNLLDTGTLYVAKFNANGTGEWRALVQGQNGLVAGAQDPGVTTQSLIPPAAVTVNFNTQADVLIETKAAARVAGGTLMDRPEWITVGPDKRIYVTCTNNSGRAVTDTANPRTANRQGHIIRWSETGNSPTATTFNWEIFLLAGDPRLSAVTEKGNINGDTFSSPDGIAVDPKGRLWVQTDAGTSSTTTNTYGNNAMYYLDQSTKESKRFLVGPNGCEITGLAYTPDLKTFFINIQHPNGTWPSNLQGNTYPARSSTIVVRRADGKPVGA
ncbi:MAG: PhoX family phosphatase [Brachymonas sp.]|nr:PhoX family phosphatase [Brachymonas sp.]